MGLTKIEWTGKTWNPIKVVLKEDARILKASGDYRWVEAGKVGYHCVPVSAGCKHCYAESMNKRCLPSWGTGLAYSAHNSENVQIFLDEDVLAEPLRWKQPTKIFPCSMTDWAADFVPDWMMDALLLVAVSRPDHTFQFLTKRADRLEKRLASRLPLPNVQLGFSAEDQPNFDKRWESMRKLAAAGWFVWCSYEPALGPLDVGYLTEDGLE